MDLAKLPGKEQRDIITGSRRELLRERASALVCVRAHSTLVRGGRWTGSAVAGLVCRHRVVTGWHLPRNAP